MCVTSGCVANTCMHVYLEMDGLNFSDRLLLLRSVYPCGLHSCLCFFSLRMYAGLCMYVCMYDAHVLRACPCGRACASVTFLCAGVRTWCYVPVCWRVRVLDYAHLYRQAGWGVGLHGTVCWSARMLRLKMWRIAQLRDGVRRDCVEWRAQTLLCCMATGSLAFGKRPLQCPQIMKSYFIFIALLSL